MKKILLAFTLLVSLSAFTPTAPKPKLFADIEKYYAGLSATPDPKQVVALHDLSSYILQGATGYDKLSLVFTCPDNSFKSVAAQIVLQSLLSVNKIGKLSVYSGGYQPAAISPQLIKVLGKHGFLVTESPTAAGGQKSYEIKFGENMPSLIVYAKGINDASVSQSKFFLMKLCNTDEGNCTDLPGAFFKSSLPFAGITTAVSDEEADKEFTAIATAMVYAFNKSKP